MRLTGADVYVVELPMTGAFRSSSSSLSVRRVAVLRVEGADGEVGWGECAALNEAGYTSEWTDGAAAVIVEEIGQLLDRELAVEEIVDLHRRLPAQPMARAAIELAHLDAELRHAGRSLASHLGATRTHVESGVSVGLAPTVDDLLAQVGAYVDAGYRRVKVKIEPGRDLEVVDAVRAQHPDLPLMVDANGAYSPADADRLAVLDAHDLLLIEQPLAEDDLAGHAALAARLDTPICLDESLTSLGATAHAIDVGACEVVNLKAGRVGGYAEAVRIHDLCIERGVPLWLGGMLETGLGRAANCALAALPGFTLPGDLSASDRYFPDDLTEPFVLDDGRLAVPTGPGLGVEPIPERLERFTVAHHRV